MPLGSQRRPLSSGKEGGAAGPAQAPGPPEVTPDQDSGPHRTVWWATVPPACSGRLAAPTPGPADPLEAPRLPVRTGPERTRGLMAALRFYRSPYTTARGDSRSEAIPADKMGHLFLMERISGLAQPWRALLGASLRGQRRLARPLQGALGWGDPWGGGVQVRGTPPALVRAREGAPGGDLQPKTSDVSGWRGRREAGRPGRLSPRFPHLQSEDWWAGAGRNPGRDDLGPRPTLPSAPSRGASVYLSPTSALAGPETTWSVKFRARLRAVPAAGALGGQPRGARPAPGRAEDGTH